MGNCGSAKNKDAVCEPAVPPPSKAAGAPTPTQVPSDKPVKSILKATPPAAAESAADKQDADKAAAEAEKMGKDVASDVISDALVKLEKVCSKKLLIQNEKAAAAAAERERELAELAASVTSGAIEDALKKHDKALAAEKIQAGRAAKAARQEAEHKKAVATARAPPKVVAVDKKPSSPKLAAAAHTEEASPAPRATGGVSPPDMSPVPSPLVAAMKAEAPPEAMNDSDELEANEWLSGHLSHMRSQSSMQRQKSGNLQRKKSGSSKGKKNSRGPRNSHEEGAVEAQRSVYIKN